VPPPDRPPIREPQQERSAATRARIVAAGKELMGRDGYHGTSSKKIAAAAGVSIGSFYNHFRDKKDLLIEIHRQHSQEVHEVIGGAIAEALGAIKAPGDLERIRGVVELVMRAHDLSPELHREFAALMHTDPDVAAMHREQERGAVEALMAVLRAHGRDPGVPDLEAAAWVVASSMESVIHDIKMFDPPVEPERMLDALAEMLHRFLYPREGA